MRTLLGMPPGTDSIQRARLCAPLCPSSVPSVAMISSRGVSGSPGEGAHFFCGFEGAVEGCDVVETAFVADRRHGSVRVAKQPPRVTQSMVLHQGEPGFTG